MPPRDYLFSVTVQFWFGRHVGGQSEAWLSPCVLRAQNLEDAIRMLLRPSISRHAFSWRISVRHNPRQYALLDRSEHDGRLADYPDDN